MSNRIDRWAAGELEARFPGLARTPAEAHRVMGRLLRAFGGTLPPEPADPAAEHNLLDNGAEERETNAAAAALFGPYWADPRRMSWTPMLAAAGARLWELAPGLFRAELAESAEWLALATLEEEPLDDVGRLMVAQMAVAVTPIFRTRCREERAVAELGLKPAMSLAARVEALRGWLAVTERPAAWVAVQLPAALLLSGPAERLLQASGPYRELGQQFGALAERQGVKRWEDAILAALAYWRDPRGSAWLESLAHPPAAAAAAAAQSVAAAPAAGAAAHGERHRATGSGRAMSAPDRTLLRKLASRMGRAERAAAAAGAEADAMRVQLSALKQDLAEARRGRDRAAERLRKVEGENVELRKALAAATPMPAPSQAEPAPPRVMSFPEARPAPLPRPEDVLSGRKVYLYTGVERAAAREALAGALEHYGARVELFDGNRATLLGPERFPADALVVIETSHLCHSSSDRLVARARASGAWYWVGSSGCGALARKVVERWVRRERGVG